MASTWLQIASIRPTEVSLVRYYALAVYRQRLAPHAHTHLEVRVMEQNSDELTELIEAAKVVVLSATFLNVEEGDIVPVRREPLRRLAYAVQPFLNP